MEKYKKLNDRNFTCFMYRKYENGILTINLDSWNEFHDVVGIFGNNTDYVWRGQPNKKLLIASIDRPVGDHNKRDVKALNNRERRNKLNYLAWANEQHYGGQTPFLDWTECPYIAAHFAFRNNESVGGRAIYALNRAVKRLLFKKKKSGKVLSRERSIEFVDPGRDTPDAMQNERLISQKGKFTNALFGIDIKTNVESLYNRSYKSGEVLLAEFFMPETFRDECLQYLESKKINDKTLKLLN